MSPNLCIESIFFDLIREQMGMMTVLVAGATAKEEGDQPEQLIKEGIVDFVVADCTESELRRMIPGLFAPSLVDVAA